MATPKQLAALKKARAARAKKKKPVTAKSQVTGKAPSKRLKKRRAENTKKGYFPNPVKSRKTSPKFLIEIKIKRGAVGYLTSSGKADTDIKYAQKLILQSAEKKARDFFNTYEDILEYVKVIPAPK